MKLFDIVVKAGFAKSKTEARKSISGKGIRLNNFTIIDQNADVFVHNHLWLIVEPNRLTVIDTTNGEVTSKDITLEEYKQTLKDSG